MQYLHSCNSKETNNLFAYCYRNISYYNYCPNCESLAIVINLQISHYYMYPTFVLVIYCIEC